MDERVTKICNDFFDSRLSRAGCFEMICIASQFSTLKKAPRGEDVEKTSRRTEITRPVTIGKVRIPFPSENVDIKGFHEDSM